MARTFPNSLPSIDKQSQALGNRLRLARLRRKLSMVLFAERMGVSRETLRRLEAGDPNVALGTYLRALRLLELDKDMDLVARDDEAGRKLQDMALVTKPRAAPSNRKAHPPVQPSEHAAGAGEPLNGETCSEGDDYGD